MSRRIQDSIIMEELTDTEIVTNSRSFPKKRTNKKKSSKKYSNIEIQTDFTELPELFLAFKKTGTIPNKNLIKYTKLADNNQVIHDSKQKNIAKFKSKLPKKSRSKDSAGSNIMKNIKKIENEHKNLSNINPKEYKAGIKEKEKTNEKSEQHFNDLNQINKKENDENEIEVQNHKKTNTDKTDEENYINDNKSISVQKEQEDEFDTKVNIKEENSSILKSILPDKNEEEETEIQNHEKINTDKTDEENHINDNKSISVQKEQEEELDIKVNIIEENSSISKSILPDKNEEEETEIQNHERINTDKTDEEHFINDNKSISVQKEQEKKSETKANIIERNSSISKSILPDKNDEEEAEAHKHERIDTDKTDEENHINDNKSISVQKEQEEELDTKVNNIEENSSISKSILPDKNEEEETEIQNHERINTDKTDEENHINDNKSISVQKEQEEELDTKVNIIEENASISKSKLHEENEEKNHDDSNSNTDSIILDDNENNNFGSNYQENLDSIRKHQSLYLRWLVKISDEKPLSYKEIPKEFIEIFTLPGLSQALNLSITDFPAIDWSKVENYIDNNSFSNYKNLAEGIHDNFNTDFERLYASYYFITHNIQYDHQREMLIDKKELSIDEIFNNKKGVCADYSKFQRELTKRSGVKTKSIPVLPFKNASKGSGWNAFHPINEPDFDHEANIIKINNEYFISEPTWGSGSCDSSNEFHFNYSKSYFLIPYYKSLVTHFPQGVADESLNISFSYDMFKILNKPNYSKELSFESNPFQVIKVDNDGIYEFQFSFIQPVDSLFAHLYLYQDDSWHIQDDMCITLDCLAKNLPSHYYSLLSSDLRCRYKMTVYFQEAGKYKVETYLNTIQIFKVFFDVENVTEKSIGISGKNIVKNGFIPIVPLSGLTKVTNGMARIRFAVKFENSPLLIKLYQIKQDTYEREMEIESKKNVDMLSLELPFKYSDGDNELVEDWIRIIFPKDGRYEVEIYFKNDEESYTYGVKYFFDVTSSIEPPSSPLFDLPKNRKFASFQPKTKTNIRINPPTQSVVLDDFDFYFNLYGERDFTINIIPYEGELFWPSLISKNESCEENITDFEYSITFPSNGIFQLIIFNDCGMVGSQNYYVLEEEDLQEESKEEKKLMEELKSKLEGKFDYNKDIPIYIRKNVENLLKSVAS